MIKCRRAVALVLLALAAAPCSADIYAYVDENGRGHFSDVPLDARYELYMKEKPRSDKALEAPAESAANLAAAAFDGPTSPQTRKRYADMISKVAREEKVDVALLHAVVTVESAYNAAAKSPKGATGLMQLMPETAKRYGVSDLLNPLENLRAGASYLRDLLALFDNNMKLAIAAYNAGEGAVIRAGNAIPRFAETRAYVPRVMQHYQRYRAAHRAP
jgi:soluble lytic murein transglycosylase-like protein